MGILIFYKWILCLNLYMNMFIAQSLQHVPLVVIDAQCAGMVNLLPSMPLVEDWFLILLNHRY